MSTALTKLAESTGVSSSEITEVVRGMIISSKSQHGATATDAEMTVVAGICAKYGLNPMVREAHAFVSGGKLQVMIGIDGWYKIMTRHKDFDGFEQEDKFDEKGDLFSVTTKIYLKGKRFPVPHTEYMSECYQPRSDAWKKYKNRMLTNKSLGQTIRIAFGISEMIDDDEASRIKSNQPEQVAEQIIEVDLNAVDMAFKECGDIDSLKAAAAQVRSDMQANQTWDANEQSIIGMFNEQKSKIEIVDDIVDAEIVDE